MNTAVKTVSVGVKYMEWPKLSQRTLIVIALILMSLMTAFAVVYVKDLNRRLFSDVQVLQYERDDLYVEWGQLLLEQSAWSTQARIQKIAHQEIEMTVPKAKEIHMVRAE